MEEKKGWRTIVTKDGKQRLDSYFYATNLRYIEVHNQWDWEECGYHMASSHIASEQTANAMIEDRP